MSDPGGYRSYAGDDMITGEGVAVEVPVASVAARMASGAIDVFVTLVVLIAGVFAIGFVAGGVSDAVIGILFIGLSVLAFIVLPTAVETLTRGRSLGRMALGLRTLRDDGGPTTFRHALVRGLVGYVEIYLLLGVPAVIASMVHPRSIVTPLHPSAESRTTVFVTNTPPRYCSGDTHRTAEMMLGPVKVHPWIQITARSEFGGCALSSWHPTTVTFRK